MARKIIDTTTNNGSYIGDPAKVAFGKANDNFEELYGIGQADGSNLLINPELRINQRVFAGGALAANVYGYDRWKAGSSACNVSANNGLITHTSGPLVQVLENPGLASAQVTLSVLSPSAALNVSIGGVTATIAAGTGRRSATVTLPAGATGNVIVQITATNATYRQLKLELGASATPFSPRPIGAELSLCRRYYEKSYEANTKPGTVTSFGNQGSSLLTSYLFSMPMLQFTVEKRATPAVTAYSPQNGSAGNYAEFNAGSAFVANRPLTLANLSAQGFEYLTNGAGAAGNSGRLHWVAESEL